MPPPRLRTLTTTLLYFLTLFILPTTCAPSYLTNPYSTERLPTPTSSHNDPTPFTQWVEYLQHQRWVLLATWLIFIFDALSCAVMLWLWIAGWEQAMERCDGWVGLIFCCLGGRRRRHRRGESWQRRQWERLEGEEFRAFQVMERDRVIRAEMRRLGVV